MYERGIGDGEVLGSKVMVGAGLWWQRGANAGSSRTIIAWSCTGTHPPGICEFSLPLTAPFDIEVNRTEASSNEAGDGAN